MIWMEEKSQATFQIVQLRLCKYLSISFLLYLLFFSAKIKDSTAARRRRISRHTFQGTEAIFGLRQRIYDKCRRLLRFYRRKSTTAKEAVEEEDCPRTATFRKTNEKADPSVRSLLHQSLPKKRYDDCVPNCRGCYE